MGLRQLLNDQKWKHQRLESVTLVAICKSDRSRPIEISGEDIFDIGSEGVRALREGEDGDETFIPYPTIVNVRLGECVVWQRYGEATPSGTIVLVCDGCEARLTGRLRPTSLPLPRADGASAVEVGHYSWSEEDFGAHAGKLIVDIKDTILCAGRPERRSGCCGCCGLDGPNLACVCGRAVATEVSDCWTPYFVAFEAEVTSFWPVVD